MGILNKFKDIFTSTDGDAGQFSSIADKKNC